VIYVVIVIIVLVLGIKYYYQLPVVKGRIGEKRVDKQLKKCAINYGGVEMTDLMFEDDRSTSQIDNLLLTQKALYVVEVKNYNGHIYGNQLNNNWTMTVKHVNTKRSKSGKKYRKTHISKHTFYNPLRQNKTHINKIKKIIPSDIPIVNIVVFGNKAVLKDVSHNKDVYVVNTKRLTKLIAQLENEFRVSYNLINQVEIIDTFYSFNITDKKERKAHVKRLKKKYSGH
jgi:hypothetical protein